MRLGYACVNTRLPSAGRTLRLANVTADRLRELIAANLHALDAILRWNVEHGIEVFRVTSDLIPFGSHPVNELHWEEEFAGRFAELAAIVRDGRMRLSTHPGQYTVLSSARPEVVSDSVRELEHQARLLAALGVDRSHGMVIHVGSGGAEADAARERFAAGFARLSPQAAGRLVLENDERWPLAEVLPLAERLGCPVVFDAFHHTLAPSLPGLGVRELVLLAAGTWGPGDGRQEVHFSTQAAGKRPGAHAESLDLDAFAGFAAEVGDLPLDCIVEVKDKERSVLAARERAL
jgi:UV DNA damage endonuclease